MSTPDEDRIERVSAVVQRSMAHAERYVLAAGPEATAAQKRLERLLADADALLGKRLNDWIARTGDADAFTAASAQSYRVQIQAMIARSQEALQQVTHGTAMTSWAAGSQAVVAELAALDTAYTGIARTPRIRQALRFDESRGRASSVLRSIETSVDRYGPAMISEFERTMAVGMTAGLTQHEMVDLLTGHGGPAGEVSMRARLVDGRVVRTLTEEIPEGLFRRYRSWAWRIVRTETANAYNGARVDRMLELREDIPTLKKKILAHFDNRTAPDSVGVHGQVRDLDGPNAFFLDGAGRSYEHPPARPNDRETTIPWDSEWDEVPSTAPLTPNQQEQADQAIARGQQPFDPARRREEDLAAESEQYDAGMRNLNERWAPPSLPEGHTMAVSTGGENYVDVFNGAGTKVSYFSGSLANGGPFTVNVPAGLGLTMETKLFEDAVEAANYSIQVGQAIQAAKAAQAAAALAAQAAAEAAAVVEAQEAAKAAAKAARAEKRRAAARRKAGVAEPTATNRYEAVDFDEDPVARLARGTGFRQSTGTAVPFDADQFEGHEVQFRVEIDREGREWTVARFKLTENVEASAAQVIRPGAGRIDGYTWQQSDVLADPTGTIRRIEDGTYSASAIGYRRDDASGGRVELYRDRARDSDPRHRAGELSAMHGHVEVHIPSTDPQAVIDHFGRMTETHLGLHAPTARPTVEARRTHVRARILARYGGQLDQALMATSTRDATAIDRIWSSAIRQVPELAQIEATTKAVYTSDGAIAFYSDYLADQYRAAGVTRFTHDSSSGLDALTNILSDPGGMGLVSTVERWNRGMTSIIGQSSHRDVETGGSDSVFTRLSTTNRKLGARWFVDIDPLESGRLDTYAFNADRYGRTGQEIRDERLTVNRIRALASASDFGGGNETMHRRGIANRAIRRVVISGTGNRARLIANLRERGVTEIGGRPLEEVIQ